MIVAKSKLENTGIGPRTSQMQSERSTTSANPPTTKKYILPVVWQIPQKLLTRNSKMIVAKSKLEYTGIGPRTSHMQSERCTTSANPPDDKI